MKPAMQTPRWPPAESSVILPAHLHYIRDSLQPCGALARAKPVVSLVFSSCERARRNGVKCRDVGKTRKVLHEKSLHRTLGRGAAHLVGHAGSLWRHQSDARSLRPPLPPTPNSMHHTFKVQWPSENQSSLFRPPIRAGLEQAPSTKTCRHALANETTLGCGFGGR